MKGWELNKYGTEAGRDNLDPQEAALKVPPGSPCILSPPFEIVSVAVTTAADGWGPTNNGEVLTPVFIKKKKGESEEILQEKKLAFC